MVERKSWVESPSQVTLENGGEGLYLLCAWSLVGDGSPEMMIFQHDANENHHRHYHHHCDNFSTCSLVSVVSVISSFLMNIASFLQSAGSFDSSLLNYLVNIMFELAHHLTCCSPFCKWRWYSHWIAEVSWLLSYICYMSVYIHMLRGEKYLRLAPWFQLPFLTRGCPTPVISIVGYTKLNN